MNEIKLYEQRIELLKSLRENEEKLKKLGCSVEGEIDQIVEKYENLLNFQQLFEQHYTSLDRIEHMTFKQNFQYCKLIEKLLDLYSFHKEKLNVTIKRQPNKPITIPVFGYSKKLSLEFEQQFLQFGIKTLDRIVSTKRSYTGRKCSDGYGALVTIKESYYDWVERLKREKQLVLRPKPGDYVISLDKDQDVLYFDGEYFRKVENFPPLSESTRLSPPIESDEGYFGRYYYHGLITTK